MDGRCAALHCVFATDSFAEAVVKAVNMRGDADSVASVAGQLAGAIYGLSAIPAEWIARVEKWDGGSIAARAHCLFANVPLAVAVEPAVELGGGLPAAAGEESEPAPPPLKKRKEDPLLAAA